MDIQKWVLSIMTVSALYAVYKLGTDHPWAMGAAGFAVTYHICHRLADGFRIRSVMAGLFGFMAAWMLMGYLHMDGQKNIIVMLFLCIVLTIFAVKIGSGLSKQESANE